jgi:glycosyltransferase involved in cell wall biosynthesis
VNDVAVRDVVSATRARSVPYVHRTQHQSVEAVHIEATVRCLCELGYEVDVIGPNPPGAQQPVRGSRRSVRSRVMGWISAHCPELVFELLELAYNVPTAIALMRLTRRPARLIFERYAIFAFAATCVARMRGVPLVMEVNATASTPILRRRSRLLLPLARRVDRFIFRRATLLLPVSSYLREHLIRDLGVAPDRILVNPNAADPRAFDPGLAPVQQIGAVRLTGRKVIGFVGTFAPWHGVGLLLEAFAALAARHPDSMLLLVGDGPERRTLERRAAEAGLSDRVIFPGTVPHRELARYVAAFRIAVLPDTNEYCSPMKIFEYMAMGRAIVAPDYGNVRDVLAHGENGFIFRPRDLQSLGGALEELLADDHAVQRLGQAARRSVVERRNWMCNTSTWLRALEALEA